MDLLNPGLPAQGALTPRYMGRVPLTFRDLAGLGNPPRSSKPTGWIRLR